MDPGTHQESDHRTEPAFDIMEVEVDRVDKREADRRVMFLSCFKPRFHVFKKEELVDSLWRCGVGGSSGHGWAEGRTNGRKCKAPGPGTLSLIGSAIRALAC